MNSKMQIVLVEQIVEVSSEHPEHTAQSLVTGFGHWTTESPAEERAELTVKLDQLVEIARIEIANESSAWLDIRVSREGTPFSPLLPTICLQSRKESKEGTNTRAKRSLEAKDFNEDVRHGKFDLVKVICRQPFNRSVLYGLSHLKFFTNPPEEEESKRSKSLAAPCDQEVVLEIVLDSKENQSAGGNELAAVAIKKASLQDITREKRFVNTPVNDGDPDGTVDGGELRAKPILKHFTESNSSTPITSKRVSLTERPVGAISRPSFVFAPKTSASEQEARVKKAAAAAVEVIPGRSPKKPRTSAPSARSQPSMGESPTKGNIVDDAEGDVDRSFLKKTLSKWTKQRAGRDLPTEPMDDSSGSPVERPGKTKSSLSSLTPSRETPQLSEENPFNIENESPVRVPPPKVRSSLPNISKKPGERGEKRRSVAEVRSTALTRQATLSEAPVAKKARTTTEVLQGLFSSSEDEATPLQGNNSPTDGCIPRRVPPPGSKSSMAIAKSTTTPAHSPAARMSEPAPSGERSDLETSASKRTPKRNGREQRSSSAGAAGNRSPSPTVVKPEVHSDGEDLPVVIKTEVIDLGDSDDAAVTAPTRKEAPTRQKKQTRNPPAGCEVESDSDLEVVGNDLMRGVVFALSGFKNPYRSSLRSMAISMGARYRPDWDNTCTHLVCAFKNTPKYNEVRSKGGKIVTAAWIATSHLKQKLANWKNYRLE